MSQQIIKLPLQNIEELTAVIAGLTKEGLVFTVTMRGGDWQIEITGY